MGDDANGFGLTVYNLGSSPVWVELRCQKARREKLTLGCGAYLIFCPTELPPPDDAPVDVFEDMSSSEYYRNASYFVKDVVFSQRLRDISLCSVTP